MGGQIAAPRLAQEVGGCPVPLIGEGGARHAAGGVAQGGPLTAVIKHDHDPLGELATQPVGPFGGGWRDLGQLPFGEWWPARHEAGESFGDPWVGRPLDPSESICYRVSDDAPLGEAARGGGATDHDVEGEGVGELVGDDDPCDRCATCGDEGWPTTRERRQCGGQVGEAVATRLGSGASE